MNEFFLLKEGEIALKGLNKKLFEGVLIRNVKSAISELGGGNVSASQSVIRVIPNDDPDAVFERLKKVFGVQSICRCKKAEKDFDDICRVAGEFFAENFTKGMRFKVEAKRSDKKFPMDSLEIMRELGGYLLENFPDSVVDVKKPEFILTVEIRGDFAYIHKGNEQAAGGLPVGTSGTALVLLSGGIDSPVAAYMIAKRGVKISAIHFEAPPYTSERAKLKVKSLAEKITPYCGSIDFYCVPFTEIQEKLRDNIFEEYFTIIMRRLMIEISNRIADKYGIMSLVTGESIGQVASQTMGALQCSDAVANIPIFRPVIGMDKTEITDIARKIDTFEISSLPFEDCCTIFTPKHPKTRPVLKEVERIQAEFDFEPLIQKAVENTTFEKIN
ncbi:MAG: tRNA 4-thiouridine(8) synthase ThiI [Ruminococcus sp.]|jgi:thiamine biosynthesis protein ThiI|nr:tRNA 4-thiouridine(8) synthase ThiI [Ruminococcus sp.]